jgi:steroid 5-alpha reductase family enzyme
MTFWNLVLSNLGCTMVFMASAWVLAYAVNNAGIVDVAWAFAFSFIAGMTTLLGPLFTGPGMLLAGMLVLWSVRLGSYLLKRVSAHHPEEDPRYKTLRTQFPQRTWLMFFGFFQAQALLAVLLSLPLFLVTAAGPKHFHVMHLLGLLIWMLAVAGEAMADRQLHHFRSNPANRGHTCRAGLWRYSRHPNYFFEWLVWVAYFVYALPSPLGWLTIIGPVLMLFFLFRVTGIPATEAQALRSRGDEYRQYQQTTNAFFPGPPRSA